MFYFFLLESQRQWLKLSADWWWGCTQSVSWLKEENSPGMFFLRWKKDILSLKIFAVSKNGWVPYLSKVLVFKSVAGLVEHVGLNMLEFYCWLKKIAVCAMSEVERHQSENHFSTIRIFSFADKLYWKVQLMQKWWQT